MKAVVYDRPRHFSVTDVPTPEPGPDEVRLRSSITGLCGTDLHIHEGGFFAAYPLIPGHEIVGVVDEIGAEVEDLRPGQRVAADNTVLCGKCYFCRRDQPLFCRNFYSLGVNGPGAFAEYLVVRAEKCFPVDDLPLDTAVMVEPTACAIHGMDVLDLKPGSDVLLFGAGPTGLVLAQLLVHGGAARLTVAAPTEFKLDLARSFGVDETVRIDRSDPAGAAARLRHMTEQGFDVVIDATGSAPLVEQCVSLVRDGGTVLIYGMGGEQDRIPFSPYEVFRRELTIKGSFAQTHCFDRSIAVLRSGRVRTDGILTHRVGLMRFGSALETVRSDRSCVKSAIVPDEGG